MALPGAELRQSRWPAIAESAPGIALAALVAGLAYLAAKTMAAFLPVPTMVLALIFGMALNAIAMRPVYGKGIQYSVRTVLRCAIALMGLRIGLSEIAALGTATAALVIFAMVATAISGFLLARWHGQTPEFGALVGVGTAICGASAALATSTVLRDYPGKQADIAFVVVAVNALATLALLVYPPICLILGFSSQSAGIMLGGTIHDVAQVAGAGYAMSDATGSVAVVVKLFRVFMLLPAVLCVGLYFKYRFAAGANEARVPVPTFAVVFVIMVLLNSAAPSFPALSQSFDSAKSVLIAASNLGLLLAIAALGLSTSLRQIIALGWRHVSTVCGATVVILVITVGGLLWLQ